MAYSWRVLLLVTGVTSVGWAAQPEPTGQLRKYSSETPAVSAIEGELLACGGGGEQKRAHEVDDWGAHGGKGQHL